MINKPSRFFPIIDSLGDRMPEFAEELQWDNEVLGMVDRMLSAPTDQIDVISEATRILIMLRDGKDCNDARLANEIDQASIFICNEELLTIHKNTSRYVGSGF